MTEEDRREIRQLIRESVEAGVQVSIVPLGVKMDVIADKMNDLAVSTDKRFDHFQGVYEQLYNLDREKEKAIANGLNALRADFEKADEKLDEKNDKIDRRVTAIESSQKTTRYITGLIIAISGTSLFAALTKLFQGGKQ